MILVLRWFMAHNLIAYYANLNNIRDEKEKIYHY